MFSQPKPVEELTRNDVLSMSFDELSVYSLEEIMKIAEIVGVSTDDLFKLLLNKDISIASKQEESYFDTPLSTSVLTAADIQRSGALSIPEALRLLPGIIVREKTNGNYDVHIRSSNNIAGQQSMFSENTLSLVMIDGRSVYNYITGGTFWESLPIGLADIERIEVIRGPASAMYGANAVTGVINIITQKASPEKLSIQANFNTGGAINPSESASSVGGIGTQSLAALFNVNNKLKFKVSGNYTYRERTQSDIFFFMTDRFPVLTASLATSSAKYYPVDSVVIHGVDPKKMFRNPNRALQAYGVNGLASYSVNNDVHFDLTTGMQRSDVISSNLDFYFFAHTTRQIESQYVNLLSKIYGFDIQAGYTWGKGDLAVGIPGLKADMTNFNLNIEYNYKWNNLNINPGFYFYHNTLNSDPYKAENQSYFEGKRLLYSFAPSIRLDYKLFEKLRFIGALRLEKNNHPDKAYLTWQLVGNYKFNENSLIRAVYSRANKSPFMMDININSTVHTSIGHEKDIGIRMMGNKDLKLAVMDMFELGYRQKIGEYILLNAELFYTRIKDLNISGMDEMHVYGQKIQIPPTNTYILRDFYPYYMAYSFKNIPEVQKQLGATLELGIIVNNDLNFRLWGTLQETRTEKHNENPLTMMALGEEVIWNPSKYEFSENDYQIPGITIEPELVDKKSKSTPSFYGGYEMNWKFAQKFSFFSNGYGFSKQDLSTYNIVRMDIKAKMLINARVSYHFIENSALSFSVNNILNATTQEYEFMDKVGTYWNLGLNVKF
ncbi:MAG: TonB-dependent receptor [Bacteroidales bacterium]|jgi:iron complex outermembrane receptor protein|nr:TonB-dependent receptor [Bacteroidales bacterium]